MDESIYALYIKIVVDAFRRTLRCEMLDLNPPWLDRAEYPFHSRALRLPAGSMHYVDEGQGKPILFVHGNPSWSFTYRHLIRGLSDRWRCVAPDHLGFGLSEKPRQADYGPRYHAKNLADFVRALGLSDITLVIHDWGGPIGMAFALDHPELIERLIVFNTTVWSLKGVAGAERFSRFVSSPFGHFLFRRLNIFPKIIVPRVTGEKERFTKNARRHYVRPFPTPATREAPWILVKSLIAESEWMDSLWAKRDRLAEVPVLILAGERDPTFGPEKIDRWMAGFPHAELHRFPKTGHFVAEEQGEALVPIVAWFLGRGAPLHDWRSDAAGAPTG